ncbi:hypothetical protein SUGI_0527610, partial [Cryptomeria japonica]
MLDISKDPNIVKETPSEDKPLVASETSRTTLPTFGTPFLAFIVKCCKMSLIPSLWGRRSSPVYDPFSLDVWDRFQLFDPSISKDIAKPSTDFARDAAAIANTQIDWKETPDAHVFKADLPGLKKEEVKIEVEDGRILQISGERSKEEEQKNEKYH